MTLENQRLSSAPKWVNPCGLADECPLADPNEEKLSDSQLLRQIILQAKNALSHAMLFRENFIRSTFNADFEEFHQSWKDRRYNWLPSEAQIPKQLGQDLDPKFLDNINLDIILLDVYEYLQKIAVGLEQIVWDQKDHNLGFAEYFAEAEIQLRAVLCEIQVVLLERGVSLREDVGRDIMPVENRKMSTSRTDMNLRDWLIFRDYMNALEFVIQVFEYLLMNLEQ